MSTLSATQAFNAYIQNALVACQSSPTKSISVAQLKQIAANSPAPSQKTITKNGKSISFPAGYKNFADYLSTALSSNNLSALARIKEFIS